MRSLLITLVAAGLLVPASDRVARADANVGELTIDGTPAGTTVRVTGPGGFSARGELPFGVRRLAAGTYSVTATHEGYTEAVVSARVRSGESASVRVALVPEPVSPIGGAVGPAAPSFTLGTRRRSADRPSLTVPGPLTSHEIGPIVKAHLDEINLCYQQERVHDPALAGKVTVHWEIGPKGTVTDAAVTDSELHNGIVEACMLKVIRALKFPAPRGGGVVMVNYPFHFKAE